MLRPEHDELHDKIKNVLTTLEDMEQIALDLNKDSDGLLRQSEILTLKTALVGAQASAVKVKSCINPIFARYGATSSGD